MTPLHQAAHKLGLIYLAVFRAIAGAVVAVVLAAVVRGWV